MTLVPNWTKYAITQAISIGASLPALLDLGLKSMDGASHSGSIDAALADGA